MRAWLGRGLEALLPANLIRYQQSYAASAQVVSTAKTIFDTLLSSVR